MQRSGNIAGRVGRWSARHRKAAILGWLAFVLAALAVSTLVPQGELTAAEQSLGAAKGASEPLPGFKEVQPQVFAGLFPVEANKSSGILVPADGGMRFYTMHDRVDLYLAR